MSLSSRILPLAPALLLIALTWSCGSEPAIQQPAERSGLVASRPTTTVTLPDGTEITAELARTPEEQAQGLMFRPYLGEREGMLFTFEETAPRGFWMYNTLIPLDIIWLDSRKRIAEISELTPPCGSVDSRDCPSYGGSVNAGYVLELAAGRVAAHGLKVGDRLEF